MKKVVGIFHLTLCVSNFKKSSAFYRKLFTFLGFKVMQEFDDAIGWTNGKTRFWIYAADAKGIKHKYRLGDVGYHHYAFELGKRKDVDDLHKFVKKLGAVVVDPPADYYEDYYAVFFLDPDGMKLECVKYGEMKERKRINKSHKK